MFFFRFVNLQNNKKIMRRNNTGRVSKNHTTGVGLMYTTIAY